MDRIKRIRKRIDEIDDEIIRLLGERVAITKEVGSIKADEGLAVYDPVREQEILARLNAKSSLDDSFVNRLYRLIIGYCRQDEKDSADIKESAGITQGFEGQVAVLGPAGTFTEAAAKRLFKKPEFTYCETVQDVFGIVESTGIHGVVAIENSLEGSVQKTMESLMEYNTHIVGEAVLDINLCLMTKKDAKGIDYIISHPHALAQAKKHISGKYPNVRIISSNSTAAAMQDIKEYDNAAAIGLREGAKTYGLRIIEENIQDDVSQTRFVVLAKDKSFGPKTSIIFALKDKPGALFHLLKRFAQGGINLTKIESRPSRRKLGEYLFFMDFENDKLGEEEVGQVLADIKSHTTFLKVLGSY